MTAQPKSHRDEEKQHARHESGLSVDADELGTPFLSDATEQANFESEGARDLSIAAAAPSDALLDDSDDPDASLWDRTVQRAPRSDIREIIDPIVSDEDPVDPDETDEGDAPSVVVQQSRVIETSLFDEADDEHERETR